MKYEIKGDNPAVTLTVEADTFRENEDDSVSFYTNQGKDFFGLPVHSHVVTLEVGCWKSIASAEITERERVLEILNKAIGYKDTLGPIKSDRDLMVKQESQKYSMGIAATLVTFAEEIGILTTEEKWVVLNSFRGEEGYNTWEAALHHFFSKFR